MARAAKCSICLIINISNNLCWFGNGTVLQEQQYLFFALMLEVSTLPVIACNLCHTPRFTERPLSDHYSSDALNFLVLRLYSKLRLVLHTLAASHKR